MSPRIGETALVTTGDVAAALGMSVDTVRDALVDHETYAKLSPKERRGKIPCLRIGGWSRVPRWWLERAVAALRPPKPGGKPAKAEEAADTGESGD